MTKQKIASVNEDNIAGTYHFLSSKTTQNDEYVSDKINANEFDLNVTKTGNNTFSISNFFGLKDVSLTFTYIPECNLLTSDETNTLYSNTVTLINGTPYFSMMTMFTNTNFYVEDGKLTTNTPFIIQNLEDEDDYDGNNAYCIEGGTASKESSSKVSNISFSPSESCDIYTAEGKLIHKNIKMSQLNLAKGLYILKSGNKSKKIAF